MSLDVNFQIEAIVSLDFLLQVCARQRPQGLGSDYAGEEGSSIEQKLEPTPVALCNYGGGCLPVEREDVDLLESQDDPPMKNLGSEDGGPIVRSLTTGVVALLQTVWLPGRLQIAIVLAVERDFEIAFPLPVTGVPNNVEFRGFLIQARLIENGTASETPFGNFTGLPAPIGNSTVSSAKVGVCIPAGSSATHVQPGLTGLMPLMSNEPGVHQWIIVPLGCKSSFDLGKDLQFVIPPPPLQTFMY